MANRDGHRRFGNVRRRESGRYQIRYPGPDGRMRTGPETYERKSDADRALVMIEAQIRSGKWTDPERGKVKLGDYGSEVDHRTARAAPPHDGSVPVAAPQAH